MNALNKWISLPDPWDDQRLYELALITADTKDDDELRQFLRLVKFKVYAGGAAVRFNKQLTISIPGAHRVIRYAGLNADQLLYDDHYRTELSIVCLFEHAIQKSPNSFCPHCYHYIAFDYSSNIHRCLKCDFVRTI